MYIPCIHIYIFKYIVSIYHDDAPDFLGAEKGQLQNSPWSGFGTLSASLIFSELDKESFKDFRSYKMLQAGHQTVVSYGFLGFSVMSFDGKKNNFDHLEENMFPYFGGKKTPLKAGVPGYFSDPDPSLGVSRPHPFQQFGAARSPEVWRSPSVAKATAARNLENSAGDCLILQLLQLTLQVIFFYKRCLEQIPSNPKAPWLHMLHEQDQNKHCLKCFTAGG